MTSLSEVIEKTNVGNLISWINSKKENEILGLCKSCSKGPLSNFLLENFPYIDGIGKIDYYGAGFDYIFVYSNGKKKSDITIDENLKEFLMKLHSGDPSELLNKTLYQTNILEIIEKYRNK